jgi:hypothetical protein
MLSEHFMLKGALTRLIGLSIILSLFVGCGGGNNSNYENTSFNKNMSLEDNVDSYIKPA